MPDLKYAVIFSASDQLSGKLGSIGSGFRNLNSDAAKAGARLRTVGEGLRTFGERLSIDSALMSQGAERMRQWSDAIAAPALAMEHSLATTAALTGLNNEQLGKLKDTAVAFSNTHPGVTAEEYVGGFTRMRQVFQDTGAAMRAENVSAMLSRLGLDSEAAGNLLSSAFANLGADAKTTGDQLTRTIQLFGISRPQQFAMSLGRLAGAAKETHSPLSQLMALAGQAGQLITGGRGAQIFSSMIQQFVTASAQGKTGIDISHGLVDALEQVRGRIAGLSGEAQIATLKEMGFSNPAMLIPMLDKLGEIGSKQREIENSAGALGTAYQKATANAADQLKLMHQNVTNLYDAMASPALPYYSSLFQRLTGYIQSATSATERHSAIIGDGVIGLSVLGTGLSGAVSAMSALGGVSIFVGAGLQEFSKQGNILAAATKLWAGAQWLLNAALDANPIVIAIGATVALGIAVYEIYEHWSAIAGFFESTLGKVKTLFVNAASWMETAGINLMKSLGSGILAGVEYPIHAAENLAHRIMSYFPHSPAEAGPLRNLNRITIAETIAGRIRPAPVLAAITRTAAAVAIAAPLIAAPARAGAASVSGAAIVINAPITINAGPGTDTAALEKIVVQAFNRHRYELVRAMEREQERRERTELS